MKRYGTVIKLKPEKIIEYKKLHSEVWPEVLRIIKEANIINYSIYYKDGYLFSYYEYLGIDYAGDMKKMSDNKITLKWWKLTDPCQEPLDRSKGEWWADMEEVFHLD